MSGAMHTDFLILKCSPSVSKARMGSFVYATCRFVLDYVRQSLFFFGNKIFIKIREFDKGYVKGQPNEVLGRACSWIKTNQSSIFFTFLCFCIIPQLQFQNVYLGCVWNKNSSCLRGKKHN